MLYSVEPPHFISEIFYLTAAFLHVGMNREITHYNHFIRSIGEMQQNYEQLKEDMSGLENNVNVSTY